MPHQVHRRAGRVGGALGDHVGHLFQTAAVNGQEAEARPQPAGLDHPGLGEQFGKRLWRRRCRPRPRAGPPRGIPAAQEVDPVLGQPVMHRAVDDAFQIAGSRRTQIHPVVDVDPGVRRSVFGLHGQLVAPVAHRHALGAVQGGQIVVGHLPDHSVHLRAGERFDGGHPALVDQPVVIGEHGAARIGGVGTALRHLPHAQVRPVREVGMTAALRHDLDVSRANYLLGRGRLRADGACSVKSRTTSEPVVTARLIPCVALLACCSRSERIVR